jgi:hypothetical protein
MIIYRLQTIMQLHKTVRNNMNNDVRNLTDHKFLGHCMIYS